MNIPAQNGINDLVHILIHFLSEEIILMPGYVRELLYGISIMCMC